MTPLRPNEQRLADAIIAFAAELGLPNRVSFRELVMHYGAPGACPICRIAVGYGECRHPHRSYEDLDSDAHPPP